jgi:hypothetical protein
MYREIETHKVDGDLPQNQLHILAVDEPGAGGAQHAYVVGGFDSATNPSRSTSRLNSASRSCFRTARSKRPV